MGILQSMLPWIGGLAALLTSLSYVPQVLKALPLGSTTDLSLKTLGILTPGLSVWIVYGGLGRLGDHPGERDRSLPFYNGTRLQGQGPSFGGLTSNGPVPSWIEDRGLIMKWPNKRAFDALSHFGAEMDMIDQDTSQPKPASLIVPAVIIAVAALVAYGSGSGSHSDGRPEGQSKDSTTGGLADPGRGRDAASPTEIPARGWKDVLWRTYEQIGDDRLLAVAAGVVFYGLLALFPAITALVSSYALFADPKTISDHMSFISDTLPAGTFGIVQDQVERVLAKGETKLGFAFGFSLLLAIWSANGGMKAIIDALNVVYDEKESRGFVRLNAVSLSFTLSGLFAALAAIGLVVAAPLAISSMGLGESGDAILRYGRWPALALMVLLGLALLYRFGPSRRVPKWRWVSVGGVIAAVAWLAGSSALSYYLTNFAGYDATYGSLGAAIGLMMWMWMSTIVVLFGAELNSELEHQTAKDSTDGGGRPIGLRGAEVADTVGGAR